MQRSKSPAPPVSTSPSWDDVRLFLALARARTAGEAARTLGVDTSTVSRRLAAMEEALGATLFERGRNGIRATASAEELMPVAEEIEGSMLRFSGVASAQSQVASGLVRITCPPDVAEVFVVPRLPELRAKYPAIHVELVPNETVLDLTRREADLALRIVRPTSGELVFTRLAVARWLLVASPKLARRLSPLKAWADAPWIGWGERMAGAPPARWLSRHAPDVVPVVRTDSLMLQLALARQGIGVALAPEPSVRHYGLAPIAVHRSLAEAAAGWPTSDLYVVTHQALRNVPRVRAVWELLAGAAAT